MPLEVINIDVIIRSWGVGVIILEYMSPEGILFKINAHYLPAQIYLMTSIFEIMS